MGYHSTADNKLDEAKDHIRNAAKCLGEIVIDKCEGSSEYSKEYRQKMREALSAIISVQEDLS